MEGPGFDIETSNPATFRALVRSGCARRGKVVKEAGLNVQ